MTVILIALIVILVVFISLMERKIDFKKPFLSFFSRKLHEVKTAKNKVIVVYSSYGILGTLITLILLEYFLWGNLHHKYVTWKDIRDEKNAFENRIVHLEKEVKRLAIFHPFFEEHQK